MYDQNRAQSGGASILDRLRIPVVAAPMLLASGTELVIAACREGVIGAFPTANCREDGELDKWIDAVESGLREIASPAPYAPNLIVHASNQRRDRDLAVILRRRPELVIASVGSPAPIIGPLHDAGIQVWSDVASVHHARKAIEAGVDGLILLTAGAGGQTGHANPFAFVRAVRSSFDGPIGLAGGIADGWSVWSAIALGCDFVYMGTRFLASNEARISDEYRQMLLRAELDDVHLTTMITGLETNMLRESIVRAGIDPASAGINRGTFVFDEMTDRPRAWRDIWGAGHSVSGVMDIRPVAEIVQTLESEFQAACASSHAVSDNHHQLLRHPA